jgi:hypothetical protein
MKILIIGAGWYGCHIAKKLIAIGHDIHIVDITNSFFSGSSSKNQNRLHLGFHYPRSSDTITESLLGYYKFIEEYSDYIKKYSKNLYMISMNNSKINIQDYCNIYNKYDISYNIYEDELPVNIINICSPILQVNEQYIDFKKIKDYFVSMLENYLIKIYNKDVWSSIKNITNYLDNNYDYIINCTFNHLEPIEFESYELILTLLYKIEKTDIFSYTIMDGPFFSIYPYDIDTKIYTITSVNNSILYKGTDTNFIVDNILINNHKTIIENQLKEYIPNWNDIAIYVDYFVSWKTKHDYIKDDRSIRYLKKENIISFYGGKITGIFEAERILLDIIKD